MSLKIGKGILFAASLAFIWSAPLAASPSACEEQARRDDKVMSAYLVLSTSGLKLGAVGVGDIEWAEKQPKPVVLARNEKNLESHSLKIGFEILVRQITDEQWKGIILRLKDLREHWNKDSATVEDGKNITQPIFLWRPLDFQRNGKMTSHIAASSGKVYFTTHLIPHAVHEIHGEPKDATPNFEAFVRDTTDFYETKSGDVLLATLIDFKTLVVSDASTKVEKLRFDLDKVSSIDPSAKPLINYHPLFFESPGTDYAEKGRLMVAIVPQGPRQHMENSKEFPYVIIDVESGEVHERWFSIGTFYFERKADGQVYAFGLGDIEKENGAWGYPITIVNITTNREILRKFYGDQSVQSLIPALGVDDAGHPHLFVRDRSDVRRYDVQSNEFLPTAGFEGAKLPIFVTDKSNRRFTFSFSRSSTGYTQTILQPVDGSQEPIYHELPVPAPATPLFSLGVVQTPNGSQVFLGTGGTMTTEIFVYDVSSNSHSAVGSVPLTTHKFDAIFYSASDNKIYALTHDKNGRLFVTHLNQIWGAIEHKD